MAELTEKEVRAIAKEEASKVQKEILKELSDVKTTLSRLERLLLGEMGINEEDALKAKANFAYLYAKKNTDSRVVERVEPVIEWFEDMNNRERGEKESKLESLGKMIVFYNNAKWLLGIIGVTSVLSSIPVLQSIIEWILFMVKS
jgi:hypothetical protein